MKIKRNKVGDKIKLKLSHKELVLLMIYGAELPYYEVFNEMLFDCDEFKNQKQLVKAHGKVRK